MAIAALHLHHVLSWTSTAPARPSSRSVPSWLQRKFAAVQPPWQQSLQMMGDDERLQRRDSPIFMSADDGDTSATSDDEGEGNEPESEETILEIADALTSPPSKSDGAEGSEDVANFMDRAEEAWKEAAPAAASTPPAKGEVPKTGTPPTAKGVDKTTLVGAGARESFLSKNPFFASKEGDAPNETPPKAPSKSTFPQKGFLSPQKSQGAGLGGLPKVPLKSVPKSPVLQKSKSVGLGSLPKAPVKAASPKSTLLSESKGVGLGDLPKASLKAPPKASFPQKGVLKGAALGQEKGSVPPTKSKGVLSPKFPPKAEPAVSKSKDGGGFLSGLGKQLFSGLTKSPSKGTESDSSSAEGGEVPYGLGAGKAKAAAAPQKASKEAPADDASPEKTPVEPKMSGAPEKVPAQSTIAMKESALENNPTSDVVSRLAGADEEERDEGSLSKEEDEAQWIEEQNALVQKRLEERRAEEQARAEVRGPSQEETIDAEESRAAAEEEARWIDEQNALVQKRLEERQAEERAREEVRRPQEAKDEIMDAEESRAASEEEARWIDEQNALVQERLEQRLAEERTARDGVSSETPETTMKGADTGGPEESSDEGSLEKGTKGRPMAPAFKNAMKPPPKMELKGKGLPFKSPVASKGIVPKIEGLPKGPVGLKSKGLQFKSPGASKGTLPKLESKGVAGLKSPGALKGAVPKMESKGLFSGSASKALEVKGGISKEDDVAPTDASKGSSPKMEPNGLAGKGSIGLKSKGAMPPPKTIAGLAGGAGNGTPFAKKTPDSFKGGVKSLDSIFAGKSSGSPLPFKGKEADPGSANSGISSTSSPAIDKGESQSSNSAETSKSGPAIGSISKGMPVKARSGKGAFAKGSWKAQSKGNALKGEVTPVGDLGQGFPSKGGISKGEGPAAMKGGAPKVEGFSKGVPLKGKEAVASNAGKGLEAKSEGLAGVKAVSNLSSPNGDAQSSTSGDADNATTPSLPFMKKSPFKASPKKSVELSGLKGKGPPMKGIASMEKKSGSFLPGLKSPTIAKMKSAETPGDDSATGEPEPTLKGSGDAMDGSPTMSKGLPSMPKMPLKQGSSPLPPISKAPLKGTGFAGAKSPVGASGTIPPPPFKSGSGDQTGENGASAVGKAPLKGAAPSPIAGPAKKSLDSLSKVPAKMEGTKKAPSFGVLKSEGSSFPKGGVVGKGMPPVKKSFDSPAKLPVKGKISSSTVVGKGFPSPPKVQGGLEAKSDPSRGGLKSEGSEFPSSSSLNKAAGVGPDAGQGLPFMKKSSATASKDSGSVATPFPKAPLKSGFAGATSPVMGGPAKGAAAGGPMKGMAPGGLKSKSGAFPAPPKSIGVPNVGKGAGPGAAIGKGMPFTKKGGLGAGAPNAPLKGQDESLDDSASAAELGSDTPLKSSFKSMGGPPKMSPEPLKGTLPMKESSFGAMKAKTGISPPGKQAGSFGGKGGMPFMKKSSGLGKGPGVPKSPLKGEGTESIAAPSMGSPPPLKAPINIEEAPMNGEPLSEQETVADFDEEEIQGVEDDDAGPNMPTLERMGPKTIGTGASFQPIFTPPPPRAPASEIVDIEIDVESESDDETVRSELIGEGGEPVSEKRNEPPRQSRPQPMNLWSGESFSGTVSSRVYGRADTSMADAKASARPEEVQRSEPKIPEQQRKEQDAIESEAEEKRRLQDEKRLVLEKERAASRLLAKVEEERALMKAELEKRFEREVALAREKLREEAQRMEAERASARAKEEARWIEKQNLRAQKRIQQEKANASAEISEMKRKLREEAQQLEAMRSRTTTEEEALRLALAKDKMEKQLAEERARLNAEITQARRKLKAEQERLDAQRAREEESGQAEVLNQMVEEKLQARLAELKVEHEGQATVGTAKSSAGDLPMSANDLLPQRSTESTHDGKAHSEPDLVSAGSKEDGSDALATDPAALELVQMCEAEIDLDSPIHKASASRNGKDQELCVLPSEYPFVSLLRDSSPYIVNHRHSTIVYHIPGDLIGNTEMFNSVMDDIALTWLFGMKIVLCVGCRKQILQRLERLHVDADDDAFKLGVRITSPETLRILEEEAGFCRFEVERLLNRCLRNKGADCNIVSGNLITAKEFGVVDGVDYQLTGYPTTLQKDRIHRFHARNDVVLLTPLGFTKDGEALNIHSEALAAFTAGALDASKLVYFSTSPMVLHGRSDANSQRIQMIERSNALQILSHYGLHVDVETGFPHWWTSASAGGDDLAPDQQAMLLKMGWATHAIERGVERAHIIDCEDGALLKELFTARRGFGTCISQDGYEAPHPKDQNDDMSGVVDGANASLL
ncbi:hypothetical protein ACHAXT_001737 [Thalassiosira profunda]